MGGSDQSKWGVDKLSGHDAKKFPQQSRGP